MLIYFVIYILLLFSSFKKNNNLLLWMNILILSIVAGLRDVTIGTDTRTYYDIYTSIATGNSSYIEIGWQIINRLSSYIGGFNFMLWIVSLMTLAPIGIISQRYSPNPCLSLFIYYCIYAYLNSFNIMRQILATSLVFMAYMAYYENKIKKTIIYIVVGMTMHLSAILGFAVFFMKYIKLTTFRVLLYSVISLMIGIIINDGFLSLFLGPYASYLTSSEHGYRDNVFTSFALAFIVSLIFFIIYATSRQEQKNSLWYKLYFTGLIMMNSTFQLVLGTRAIMFFTLLQFIVYPIYFRNNIIKNKMVVFWTVMLYITAIFLKILILGNDVGAEGSIIPYIPFFYGEI